MDQNWVHPSFNKFKDSKPCLTVSLVKCSNNWDIQVGDRNSLTIRYTRLLSVYSLSGVKGHYLYSVDLDPYKWSWWGKTNDLNWTYFPLKRDHSPERCLHNLWLQRMNQTSKELYNFNNKTLKKMFNKLSTCISINRVYRTLLTDKRTLQRDTASTWHSKSQPKKSKHQTQHTLIRNHPSIITCIWQSKNCNWNFLALISQVLPC